MNLLLARLPAGRLGAPVQPMAPAVIAILRTHFLGSQGPALSGSFFAAAVVLEPCGFRAI